MIRNDKQYLNIKWRVEDNCEIQLSELDNQEIPQNVADSLKSIPPYFDEMYFIGYMEDGKFIMREAGLNESDYGVTYPMGQVMSYFYQAGEDFFDNVELKFGGYGWTSIQ